MNYLILESFFDKLIFFFMEYKIIFAILWLIILGFVLKRLSKKDNELFLKDFFKKKKIFFYLLKKLILNK